MIGLDLGTSGLKALAVGDGGAVLARHVVDYPTHRPTRGAAEQDPRSWLAAVRDSLAALAGEVPTTAWAGIGLSAMIPTLVMTDAALTPLAPAITWEDARAEPFGDALRATCGGDALYESTGQWVDGRYLLPMAKRLMRERPETEAARWLLGAKDFLFAWLTGSPATDPSTATGFGCYDIAEGRWAAHSPMSLPPVLPTSTARPMRAAWATELGIPAGLPVVLGAADSVLGAYGLGATGWGDVAYLAGTSTVILGVSPELVRDHRHRYLMTPLAIGPGWGLEMDLLSTGSAVRWLASITGAHGDASEAGLLDLAHGVDPAAPDLPVFLPYLAPGEQGALWDATLTGSLVGLDLGHGRPELARALLNGILVESRRCLSVLETASGGAGPVRAAGHTTGGGFGQELADATGRDVIATDLAGDASALGAAKLAHTVLTHGLPEPWEHAATTAHPRADKAAAWQRIADRHEVTLRGVRAATATTTDGARS